ncbi:MAG: DUF1566 domain-containing protein [Gammaproteobacteria bacterium]|nr:DUF1566 domain-containing protein [Gammaproteobacteria bacterium]
MKIKVCLKCGHHNDENSLHCDYCASSSFETQEDSSAQKGAILGLYKWIILLIIALLLGGILIFWLSQPAQTPVSTQTQPLMTHSEKHPVEKEKPLQEPNAQVAPTILAPSASSPSSQNEIAPSEKSTPLNEAKTEMALQAALIEIEQQKLALKQAAAEQASSHALIAQAQKTIKQKTQREAHQAAEKKAQRKAEQALIKQQRAFEKAVAKQERADLLEQLALKEATQKKANAKSARKAARQLDRSIGVVTDRHTGLMWMACSLGQTWNGSTCTGNASEHLWSEAVSLATQTKFAGYSDWRLPTRMELHSIVQCSNERRAARLGEKGKPLRVNNKLQDGRCSGEFSAPTIDTSVFPNTVRGFYWSYSHSAYTSYSAWGIFFNSGKDYNFNSSNEGYVRLVRDIK